MRFTKTILLALVAGFATQQTLMAQNVGIGQPNPISKLDVNGGVTVGSPYTGTNTAPTNGMNIRGQVVVGRATPLYPEDIVSAFASGAFFTVCGYITNGVASGGGGVSTSAIYGSVTGPGGIGVLVDHNALADFGGLFNANGAGSVAAIKGDAADANAHGVMGESPNTGLGFAVYGNGDVNTTTAYYTISDAKLKQDIKPYVGGLTTIMALQPKTYMYNQELAKRYNFSARPQIGFLAQDLEQVLPAMVRNSRLTSSSHITRDGKDNVPTESMDAKTVNYDMLIPVLTQAIQEQQAQIQALQKEVEQLKKERK